MGKQSWKSASIFAEGELSLEGTIKENLMVRKEGSVSLEKSEVKINEFF
ncbi:MAG: hypothetical protein Q8O30_10220 [Candidatus Omnitrophota bacterium]|nr:hypothetical protein [Candidatus Omnitrophota bacterium]